MSFAAAQLGHDPVALGLGEVAVDGHRVDFFTLQKLAELVHLPFGPAEDDRQGRFFVLEQVGGEAVLVPGLYREVPLGDLRDGEALGHRGDFFDVLPHELSGELFDRIADRGRDENGLMVAFDSGENVADVLAETDVEHAVHLVQHHVLQVVVTEESFLMQVHHAARGADHDRRASLQRVDLLLVRLTAHDGDGLVGCVLGQIHQFVNDLDGQFTRRRQHQCAGPLVRVDHLQKGQAEGGGFAGSGLGLAENILPGEHLGDQSGLDVGWVFEPGILDALADGLGKAKLMESNFLVEDIAHIEVASGPGPDGAMAGEQQWRDRRGRP